MTGRFARTPWERESGPRIMARALFASTSKLAIVCAGLGEPRNRYREYAMAEVVAAYFYRRAASAAYRKYIVANNKLLPSLRTKKWRAARVFR